MRSFAQAGFAAGPCLLKDTLQLAAFAQNNFFLGHAAMLINEGLPEFLVEQLRAEDLPTSASLFWAWRSKATPTISATASLTS